MKAIKSDFARSKSILDKEAPEYLWYLIIIAFPLACYLIINI